MTSTTTRKQLRSLGLSQYLAREVTRNLTPVRHKGRAYSYSIQDVVASMGEHSNKIRVKPLTRETLQTAGKRLLEAVGSYIPVAFGESTDSELGQLAKHALQQMRKTDRNLVNLKLEAAEIMSEYYSSKDLH